jgi:hypothetical protein
LTDLLAATLSTSLMFGLGYAFANHIQNGIREFQQWVAVLAAVGFLSWMLWRYYKAQRKAGLLIGPPVIDTDFVPLPDSMERAPSSRLQAPIAAPPGLTAATESPAPVSEPDAVTGADNGGLDPCPSRVDLHVTS